MPEHRHYKGDRRYHKAKHLPQASDTADDSEIISAFHDFRKELDAKHDKYERIVKLSRDITIESKRLIFSLQALHRSSKFEIDSKKIENGLMNILHNNFKAISLELANEDPYQFLRAYSPGLQEYVEAVSLYHYILKGVLYNWKQLSQDLKFEHQIIDGNDCGDLDAEPTIYVTHYETLETLAPLSEYILGIQDLSGELMRHCINNFAAGKIENGFAACGFGKILHSGMLKLTGFPTKEFWKKQFVFKQSLLKMEKACYMMHVRGSEILRDNLIVAIDEPNETECYESDFF